MSATPPNPTELPKVLDQLKEVKSEAADLRAFTITFLSLLLYVNLIIAGTDAEQILRVSPVTLPLLNVPLPIFGFYGFLPWLLLFFHLYLLVQHYLFSQQLFRFDAALQNASPEEQAYARKKLGNLPFLHWMVGQHHSAMQFVLTLITLVILIVWPLVTLLWLQMAILPYHSPDLLAWQRTALILDVLLVGWLWPKILDSNGSFTAWWKRGIHSAVRFLSFVKPCLQWLVCRIPGLRGRFVAQPASVWQTVKSALPGAVAASALALGLSATLFLSLGVATLPDSWEERFITRNVNDKTPKPADSFWLKTVDVEFKEDKDKKWIYETTRMAFAPTAWLHEHHVRLFEEKNEQYYDLIAKDAKPCTRPKHAKAAEKLCLKVPPLLPRNLVLRGKVLTADAGLKSELEDRLQASVAEVKPEDLAQIRGLDLQNRNFDYADFTESSLPKADLSSASLKHAVLRNTRVDQAKLSLAHLGQVDLFSAKPRGVDLSYAVLPNADLSYAELPGANLSNTELPGANLSNTELPGANLGWANLSGANLSNAELPGVFLTGARLLDVNLSGADLSGVDLSDVKLFGVDLSGAKLSGAVLRINPSRWSEEQLTQAAEQYRQVLASQPNYQGGQHQKELDDEVNKFKKKARQVPDFSRVKELRPCLRKAEAENLLPDCISENALDEKSRKALADVWVRLACDDETEGHLVARRMVERAGLFNFIWFAKQLQQAARDTSKPCPGLAGLSEDYKATLQTLASQ